MKTSPFARPSPWAYREDRDDRSDSERLAEAIERHLANAGVCASLRSPAIALLAPGSLEASRRADGAYDSSQAELFRLVENMLCVDPVRLGKALTS
jgi:hypothetical protein